MTNDLVVTTLDVAVRAWLQKVMEMAHTLAELKVSVFVLDAFLQCGCRPVLLTIDQVQAGTGMARASAVTGLRRAREKGLLNRHRVDGRYEYEPSGFRGSSSGLTHEHDHECMIHECDINIHESWQSNFSCREVNRVLTQEFGVARHVAADIAARLDPEKVMQQIEYARCEIERAHIRKPAAYVVARIRDRRPAPAGYGQPPQRWYTDEEFERYFVKTGDAKVSRGRHPPR